MRNQEIIMGIYGLKDSVAFMEAQGMSKVWMAYAQHFAGSCIMEIGFNPNSGYVYIALENQITIGSCVGQDVEYIACDQNDVVHFYDNAHECIQNIIGY